MSPARAENRRISIRRRRASRHFSWELSLVVIFTKGCAIDGWNCSGIDEISTWSDAARPSFSADVEERISDSGFGRKTATGLGSLLILVEEGWAACPYCPSYWVPTSAHCSTTRVVDDDVSL